MNTTTLHLHLTTLRSWQLATEPIARSAGSLARAFLNLISLRAGRAARAPMAALLPFCLLLVSLASTVSAAPGKLAPLPPAVQQTIRTLVGTGRLVDVTRTNENGQVVYEVDMRREGVERSFTVAATGNLIARQLFLPELPAPVQQTVRAQFATGKLLEVWWTDDDGEISYEAEWKVGATKRTASIAPDGRLTSLQVGLEEAPSAVRRSIEAKLAGGKVETLHRTEEDGESLYAIEALPGGRKISFTVGLDGKLLSEGILLTDAPAPVQHTIKAQMSNGRLTELDRVTEDGETLYEVKVSRDGRKHAFHVATDGTLLSVRVTLAEVPEAARKAITAKLDGATLTRVDKATEDGATVYEVEARKAGKKVTFTVGADARVRE